jgi:hypothetical protein
MGWLKLISQKRTYIWLVGNLDWRTNEDQNAHLLVTILAVTQNQLSDFDCGDKMCVSFRLNFVQFDEQFALLTSDRRQNLNLTKTQI